MKTDRVHPVYFSPTGTTRKVVEAVVEGIGADRVEHYDLTFPMGEVERHFEDGVVVFGCPVYAGRVPLDCLERMSGYTADGGVPAVVIAVYGNREFEDALVELRDVTTAQGFKVIAAGAFIGEHSFSTSEKPIAAGRPDAEDLKLAVEFGQQVAARVERGDLDTPDMEGNVPYRERMRYGGIAPETDHGACTLCGSCVDVCPVQVITVSDLVTTDTANCIMCCACVRACSFDARSFDHPGIVEKREVLHQKCSEPKKPKVFL